MAVQSISTAAEIWAPQGGSAEILEGIIVHNTDTDDTLYVAVYRGGADSADGTQTEVTTTNGFPIGPGTSLAFDLRHGDSLRGIASTGTINARILVLRGG